MNQNLKKILVTGAALLMFTSVGVGLNGNANAAHHNVGWRNVTRATNINVRRGKRIHLHKNQRVYVIKLNKQSAEIKIGRKYYTLKSSLLKNAPRARKAIKKYKKTNRKIAKKHARKYANQKKQNAKQLAKRANKKRRRNHKKLAKKGVKVLKSHYRRSNNQRLLRKSGFIDLRAFGPDIMNKYAPNSHKAVIPKNVNIKDIIWLKGHILQKNPVAYGYNVKAHGWTKLAR